MIKDFRGRICCMIGCRRRVGECSLSAPIYLMPSQRFRACWSRDWSFFSPSPTFLHPTPSFPLPPCAIWVTQGYVPGGRLWKIWPVACFLFPFVFFSYVRNHPGFNLWEKIRSRNSCKTVRRSINSKKEIYEKSRHRSAHESEGTSHCTCFKL